jgi:hypothetical protein
MDEEAAVMGHVTRSRRMMAEMFEQGGSILANMSQNRERIKVGASTATVINAVLFGPCVCPPGRAAAAWQTCFSIGSGSQQCMFICCCLL